MSTEAKAQKRLLVVSQHFAPENFRINDIVQGLVERGAAVDVLCGLPNYPAGEWFAGYGYAGPRREKLLGAEVYRAGEIRRKGNTGLRIFLNYCSWPFFALFSLPRLRGRYDAVLCYETSPVMMLLPAIARARPRRERLVGYVLDLWPDNLYSVLSVKNPLLRKIASAVSNWHYRRCTALVALNDAQAARLREAVLRPGKRNPEIAIIPQYAEDFYAEDVDDPALRARFAGAFNILFTGNLSPAQDLPNLINAIKLVRADPDGKDVRVHILGDGMSRAALCEQVAADGLSEVIEFCGAVPPAEVPAWTGAADALFAGLAKSENLGLTVPAKIPAYLAAAKPLLVASDGESAAAALASGAALVSPAGDAEALAANILALRRMPATERAAMGAAGRAWYRRHYHRDTLLRKLEECLFEEQHA